jgi:erythromycin esterase-like protein
MTTDKETKTSVDNGAKIGEPVPRGVVETSSASVGIKPLHEVDAQEEISALRRQLETVRQQLADATDAVKGGARQVARRTEATVKLYPVSTLVTVAALAGAFAFAVARLRAVPDRSRYDRTLDDLRDMYDRVRDRF